MFSINAENVSDLFIVRPHPVHEPPLPALVTTGTGIKLTPIYWVIVLKPWIMTISIATWAIILPLNLQDLEDYVDN